MKEKEIRRYLAVIKRAVSYIENLLDHDDGGLLEEMMEAPAPVQKSIQKPVQSKPKPVVDEHQEERNKHIQSLLEIDCWPEAVPEYLTALPTLEDQQNRARSVLNMMVDRQMSGLHFLDFGCGDGWITEEALKSGAATSVGYDPLQSGNWTSLDAKFTTDFNEIQPDFYDIVFLYDVLDHCEDPEAVMAQVKTALNSDGGVVYVRCHPWTSKHATHLFKQGVNKAYLHLFLSYEEISNLTNQRPTFTRPEKNPIEAYHWWFNGFNVRKENFVEEDVSDFFKVPAFVELMAVEQELNPKEAKLFLERMRIQFVDYVLTK